MGHPTADDEPNSFIPPGGLAPDPPNWQVHLVLDDEALVEIWLRSARQMARIDSDLDVSEARRMLRTAADLVEQLVARVHELEGQ